MYYSNNNLNIVYALIVIVIHFSMQYLVHDSFVYEMNATTLNEMSDTYSSFLRFFFYCFSFDLDGTDERVLCCWAIHLPDVLYQKCRFYSFRKHDL